MSTDIQQTRSPNSPKFELEAAIALTKQLHDKIGKSPVKSTVAMNALGYKGVSGASLGALGAISQYGLIERDGGTVSISQLAIKILHPVDDLQKADAIREAALRPKIFAEIYEKWNDMSQDVLANHLIHHEFTVDGAKRAASVYKANSTLAKLSEVATLANVGTQNTPPIANRDPKTGIAKIPDWLRGQSPEVAIYEADAVGRKVLATFKIPLGFSEAELIFTGEKLQAKDFDDLKEYVDLFKKQYTRRTFPAKGFVDEKPVTVEEEIRTKDGTLYYRIQGREDHVPASQVFLA